jgi:4-phospho-D-threonate 3-dehydrogenase / 4-phospho-D-erythronate 3-dehydrogenase
MNADRQPPIVMTMGDPSGVGPELALRLLADEQLAREVTPLVFGDWGILERVARQTRLPLPTQVISAEAWEGAESPVSAAVIDWRAIDAASVVPGQVTAATGRASYTYVERAIDAALAGRIAGVATGPLSKEALHAAGIHFPGHTEIFAARCAAPRWCMMQYSETITCTFVTVHVGYREVPALLSVERILDVIELTAEAVARLRGRPPRIVVCGLNPHAGEHGLFGDREEERFIVPAIAAARRQGIQIEGPLPPDTAFVPAKRATTDAFVCMYHDQGHIPVKALAFDSAVNTTLGLPIIRTSVDHGTAADIAWQGVASPSSLFAAVRLAAKLGRESRDLQSGKSTPDF